MKKNLSIFILITHTVLFLLIYLIPYNLLSGSNLTLASTLLLVIYLTTFSILYRVSFKVISGYVFGILMFIVGFSGNIIALIFSPEYVMWKKSISLLGHHPGGMFMRIGLIISYTLAIPAIIFLGRELKEETVNNNVRKLAMGCGIFASITAILTGTFSGTNPFISSLHGLFALLSWLGGVAVCFLFGFLMLKNSKFTKLITNFTFTITGILIGYLIPFFIVNFCNLFPESSSVYSLGRSIYTIMPAFEWVVVLGVLFWYLAFSIYLLNKDKNKT